MHTFTTRVSYVLPYFLVKSYFKKSTQYLICFKPSSTTSPVAKRGANTGICNFGAMYPTFVHPVPQLSPILDLLDLMASNYHQIHGFDGSQCIYLDSFSWYITCLYALSSLFERTLPF